MSHYTYRPVVRPNGDVIWVREAITEQNSYDGMPAFPRVSSHNDVLRGGSSLRSITQVIQHRAAEPRVEPVLSDIVDNNVNIANDAGPYCRVIDID